MSTEQGINAQEEKELKRVFDHLAGYVKRTRKQKLLEPKQKRLVRIKLHQKNPDEVKIVDDNNNQMSETQIEAEFNTLTAEITNLLGEIEAINNPQIKKIRKEDLTAALKAMGKVCTKKEIDYMVWEVDDNLDNQVCWDEFRLMFHRNITDDTGLEPFMLFNIAQFMTYDKTFSGSVTVDDTMSMLYARFGREQLEPQMRKLFGSSASSADGGGSLTITDYLKAVSKREIKPKGLVECKRK
jgi:Ca2+-binding EF-hand superfamily protein